MNIGKAVGIFKNIESDEYLMPEKIEAVEHVMNMETHNGITKSDELKVIKWLLDRMAQEDTNNDDYR